MNNQTIGARAAGLIATQIVRTVQLHRLTRYEPDHWAREYSPAIERDLAAILAEIRRDSWVSVACLPLCAVLSAVIDRDQVRPAGQLGVGTTGSGRLVIGHIPGVEAGNNGPCALRDDGFTARARNFDRWVADCWVVLVLNKNPRTSTFATDPEVWGRCEWRVVREPARETGFPVPVPAGWSQVEA